MELKQLQYFVTTVQVGSITRASDVLYITQPALSRMFQRMEAELGFSLFERRHSGLVLTPAGEELYRGAEQALTTIDESVRTAKQAAGLDQEGLSIACAFEEFGNQLILEIQTHYPTITTRFSLLPPQQALQQLIANEADFAILPQMTLPESLKRISLLDEEMLLSVGQNHEFSGRSVIDIRELDGRTIVCNDVSFDEDTVLAICAEAGIHVKPTFRGNDHEQVSALKYLLNTMMFIPISALLEERILSPTGLQQYGAPVRPSRITPNVFRRKIGLVFHKNRYLRAPDLFLITSLRNHYKEIEDQITALLETF